MLRDALFNTAARTPNVDGGAVINGVYAPVEGFDTNLGRSARQDSQ